MNSVKHLIFICLALLAFNTPASQDIKCLTDTAYMEARGEGVRAMALVQDVVLNRSNARRWPDSVCAVVYQRKQFSWSHIPVPMAVLPDDRAAKAEGRQTAVALLNGERQPSTRANHFLSPKALSGGVWPMWALCTPVLKASNECVKYVQDRQIKEVRKPLTIHRGLWFYKL